MLNTPKILAPAGNTASFLAAVAAGADVIYCGLKIFSARMEADNFSIEELSRLSRLARSRGTEVYIAFNSIIKESEIQKVFRILCKLVRHVEFAGLIIQDPALMELARQAGYTGQFHLSTLSNMTFPAGLDTVRKTGFSKVVLPREFTIDEIKEMAARCPEGLELETFIHGALCYSISGRCYWSSWFGGKSALRGRCVQPCRRIYEQKGKRQRFFSCLDFSADVLAKVLKDIPEVTTWKIEGRKKSPHYVYYAVKAYKLLRDEPKEKKQALAFLDYAMGRPFTHYNLLSHRQINPLVHESETGSGLMTGRVKNPSEPFFITREPLFVSDLLRIGCEEDATHEIYRVTRAVPKKGKFFLNKKLTRKKILKGTPVYLIDRRGQELEEQINLLEKELAGFDKISVEPVKKTLHLPGVPLQKSGPRANPKYKAKSGPFQKDMLVSRKRSSRNQRQADSGLWISSGGYSMTVPPKDWLWLDPVVFPPEEQLLSDYLSKAIRKGAKNFVLNAPWQTAFFNQPEKFNLWAGPFCNTTNTVAIRWLKQEGFSGAFVSPELDSETLLSMPEKSPLPLGVVIQGNWPLGISRILSPDLAIGQAFQSPMGESAWVSKHMNSYYLFPNWVLDLSSQKKSLEKAGYRLFATLNETVPKNVRMKKRPGLWNYNLTLL